MSIAAPPLVATTLADVLQRLGDVPLRRVRLPVGDATEDDVIRALDAPDKKLCELIDGVLVEKDMGWRESLIAGRIVAFIWAYLDLHPLGIALTTDGPVRLRPGKIRIPDGCFVANERLPEEQSEGSAILDAVPDLAIEVISKGNTPAEMKRKLGEYFRAGVRLVWFIYPRKQTALQFTSPRTKVEIGKDGALSGGKVLPGLSIPLKHKNGRSRNGR